MNFNKSRLKFPRKFFTKDAGLIVRFSDGVLHRVLPNGQHINVTKENK